MILIAGSVQSQISQRHTAISPPPHTSKQSEDAEIIKALSETHEKDTVPIPATINVAVSGKLNTITEITNPNGDKEKYKWFREFLDAKITDWVIALFTIAIAYFTARLVNATIRLEGATNALVRDAGITAKKQLRAYAHVHMDERSFTDINTINPPEVLLNVDNAGQTPAYNVVINTHMVIDTIPLVKPLPPIPIESETSKIVIHPGVRFNTLAYMERVLTVEEVAALNNDGEIRLYVYGEITYEDIFGTPHKTAFRASTISPKRLPANFPKNPRGYRYCEEGNEAD